MYRTRCFFYMTVLILSSMLLSSSLLTVSNLRTAVAQDPATPTAFPLPTHVFQIFESPSTVTEEGVIFIQGGSSTESQPADFDVGDLIDETEHFLFHAKRGYVPVDLEQFLLEAEEVFDYVSARLGTTTNIKTILLFEPPDADVCPKRGLAMSSPDEEAAPIIMIFADKRTSQEQVLGVLAHEIGHILQNVGVAPKLAANHRALNEGLATWACGQYWYDWQATPSFDASVRSYVDASTYLPLYHNYDLQRAYTGENCVERRDILYTEWASFIDFLLTQYGIEQLQTLLNLAPPEAIETESGTTVHTVPADFESVYGLALNQLEALWIDYVRAQS